MNTILMFFVNNAFKEFLLPKIDNANYTVTLDRTIFEFKSDLNLALEIIDGKWSFLFKKQYTIKKEQMNYFGKALQNGDILELQGDDQQYVSIIVVQTDKTFQVFQKYDISSISQITIGKEKGNTIQYDFYGLCSRKHAKIVRRDNQFILEDTSANGIYINAKRLHGKHTLKFADCFSSIGLHMVFLGDILAISCVGDELRVNEDVLPPYVQPKCSLTQQLAVSGGREKREYFHRSPRNIVQLYQKEIIIDPVPDKSIKKKKSLFIIVGPSITMTIPMLISCILYFVVMGNGSAAFRLIALAATVVSGIIGAIWAIVNYRSGLKEDEQEEENRIHAYTEYLQERFAFISDKYEESKTIRNMLYPSAQVCCSYGKENAELWSRNMAHEDFLFVRLGLGTVPFQAKIKVPEQRFTIHKDVLGHKPRELYEKYSMLTEVPVGIDLLKDRLWGVIGGSDKKGARLIVQNIIAQIAANNCYTDVKIVIAYHEKSEIDRNNWDFIKWLPHTWSEDKKIRYFATNDEEMGDVFYELANILRIREEEKEEVRKPHYILILDDIELIVGKLIAKYVLGNQENQGLTTLILAEKYEDLPNTCENIIQNDEIYEGFYHVAANAGEKQKVRFDHVIQKDLELFTRRLAKLEVNETECSGEIPSMLDFFEMHGIKKAEELNVSDNWKKNRTYESLKALIGKKAGGTDCYLDVHEKYHGPHGLIAGTTGSGKSETLQTYILSLAINYSPNDVNFFIIDFKGGGMANLFQGLPHLIGQISNLSGNQVRRAMVSIKSENQRRQRIFNEHGVNNINLYTKLLKSNEATIPIPHLFIIIDEFAELKKEQPEFMKELISVAQVGRSLGVHLILATQKPGGTVDNNIWSNTKFRLCLRVQDKQDSNDMLHKPDAAYITQAGQCYLQVGNDEIYELFQSGWSGAIYDENRINESGIASMITADGKDAIIGSKNKRKQKEKRQREWITTIITCAKMEMEKLQISLIEAKKSPIVMQQLMQGMFQRLQETPYDYQDTKNNRLQLEEFFNVWNDEGQSGMHGSVKDVVDRTIVFFEQNRKKLPQPKERTQLEVVIKYLKRVAEENGYHDTHQLWMPILPKQLALNQLAGYERQAFDGKQWVSLEGKWSLEAMVGLCDDPENQDQMPLVVDFANDGHLAVYGSVVSGKSTFLQTMVYSLMDKYDPSHINIYCLDFSSRALSVFENAPQIGGIMYENDLDKIEKFFYMMNGILKERKELFKGGNYTQYVQTNGVKVPAVCIVIDNIAAFWEKTGEKYYNALMSYSRDGVGYGIFLMISAAGIRSNEIPNRISENIKTRICLQMEDKFRYGDLLHTMHFEIMPEADIQGRGLVNCNGSILEYQTALALEAKDDYERGDRINERCKQFAKVWSGKVAQRIPEIPKEPIHSEFSMLDEYRKIIKEREGIPIGYNRKDASVYAVQLRELYCYAVTGKRRSGKNNMLRVMMHAAAQMEADICVIDTKQGRLKKAAKNISCTYVSTEKELFHYWKTLTPVFRERNLAKHRWTEDGLEEIEVYNKMKEFKPIFIFIADLVMFMKSTYNPQEGIGAMKGFMENILEGGAMHNIYFIGAVNLDETKDIMRYKAFETFMEYKKGIHFGGNIANHKYFQFNNMSYADQNKTMKPGMGITPTSQDESIADFVVIPVDK